MMPGMPMTNMPAKPAPVLPPVTQPIVESPAQVVPTVQCPVTNECVERSVCASRFGQITAQSALVGHT